jgi:hypothetical protein
MRAGTTFIGEWAVGCAGDGYDGMGTKHWDNRGFAGCKKVEARVEKQSSLCLEFTAHLSTI